VPKLTVGCWVLCILLVIGIIALRYDQPVQHMNVYMYIMLSTPFVRQVSLVLE